MTERVSIKKQQPLEAGFDVMSWAGLRAHVLVHGGGSTITEAGYQFLLSQVVDHERCQASVSIALRHESGLLYVHDLVVEIRAGEESEEMLIAFTNRIREVMDSSSNLLVDDE